MAVNTTTGAPVLTPAQVAELVIRPTLEQSLAGNPAIATTVRIESHELRIPVLTNDTGAVWVNEGQEISTNDVVLDEELVTPSKLARVVPITRELANDSSPAATQIVGDSIARSLAKGIDQALFATVASPAPAGLSTLSGIGSIPAGTAWTSFDWAADALSAAETAGAQLTSWVTSPAVALALSKLRKATGSNEALLGADPTQPTRRIIAGLPLFISPDIEANTILGIPAAHVYTVVREDAEVVSDSSVFFTSDRVAIKGTVRVGFGFTHPAAVQKITVTA
ncbi:phage major capsid protein [Rhodococcus ruber]|uniref:phage major capsid protein n=1 Tax=Rhodococcus ruber TaxID=1830 RepID=UPI0017817096|nr:phage major capsid protein [Rhodococcus ruber]MBD8057224.1 phage major capsid protein [Rhodococcus ruber]